MYCIYFRAVQLKFAKLYIPVTLNNQYLPVKEMKHNNGQTMKVEIKHIMEYKQFIYSLCACKYDLFLLQLIIQTITLSFIKQYLKSSKI